MAALSGNPAGKQRNPDTLQFKNMGYYAFLASGVVFIAIGGVFDSIRCEREESGYCQAAVISSSFSAMEGA